MVNAPKKGEPSYEQFQKEKRGVLDSLKVRAEMVTKAFNSFEGFSCNPVAGAMYAFPQFKLPAKAIESAKKANQSPDAFYAFQLLERTGKKMRWEGIFSLFLTIFSVRYLYCARQWFRTATRNISFPYNDSAARGQVKGDAGHVRDFPQGVHGTVQVKRRRIV